MAPEADQQRLESLNAAVIGAEADEAQALTRQALEAGMPAQRILDDGLIAALDEVGERYAKGLLFVPQMLRSANTMRKCVDLLKPHLGGQEFKPKGKIVIGTVKGDLHDIGKNLVAMMLEGAGFHVADLGVDVAPEQFVQALKVEGADILAMSALLSTTMLAMPETIAALRADEVGARVKVLVGGAPVTEAYAEEIGADGYGPDAASAAGLAKKLIGD